MDSNEKDNNAKREKNFYKLKYRENSAIFIYLF